jgi:hypothetical protein
MLGIHFTTRKVGIQEIFDPKTTVQTSKTSKRHVLGSTASFEPLCVTLRRPVRPMRLPDKPENSEKMKKAS